MEVLETHMVRLRIDRELWEQLELLARDEGRSIAAQVLQLVKEGLRA